MNQQNVLTVKEMRALEAMTCSQKNISGHDLMMTAGLSLFNHIKSKIITDKDHKFLIIAGIGNNGGDALIIAQHLINDGFDVEIFIIGNMHKISIDTAKELEILKQKNISYTHLNNDTLKHFKDIVLTCDILIDGIFGFGFKAPLDAFTSQVMTYVNQLSAKIISLDIPSGLNAHNGLTSLSIVATHTLVISHYKPGNLLNDALDVQGKTALIDIGLSNHAFDIKRIKLSDSDFTDILVPRKKNSYKYHYGSCLVMGGSVGMMGAPVLAAHAALVAGAGLVSIAYHSDFYSDKVNYMPEIMSLSYENIEALNTHLKNKKAVVFGMGHDKSVNVLNALKACLNHHLPMVIDAGGFYHLKTMITELKSRNNIILTPHIKELSDLLDIDIELIKQDSLTYVEKLASDTQMIVVLKGPTTMISNGLCTYFISAGNPGLAKAGSGDVLSGIIGAFLANGHDALEAAKLGVYLHGKAADKAKDKLGERSMIATDVIKQLPKMIKKITQK